MKYHHHHHHLQYYSAVRALASLKIFPSNHPPSFNSKLSQVLIHPSIHLNFGCPLLLNPSGLHPISLLAYCFHPFTLCALHINRCYLGYQQLVWLNLFRISGHEKPWYLRLHGLWTAWKSVASTSCHWSITALWMVVSINSQIIVDSHAVKSPHRFSCCVYPCKHSLRITFPALMKLYLIASYFLPYSH